jgi:hypothetical protein
VRKETDSGSGRVSDQLTTSAGNPIADNQNSLTAGPRGPLLLQGYQLIEKLPHCRSHASTKSSMGPNEDAERRAEIPITRHFGPRGSG